MVHLEPSDLPAATEEAGGNEREPEDDEPLVMPPRLLAPPRLDGQ